MKSTLRHKTFRGAIWLWGFCLLLSAGQLEATTIHFKPPHRVEPNIIHASFVRDNNPAGRRITAWDGWYARDLSNQVTAGSVDVLLQQCFGGGFHDDISSNGPANYTSASASQYDEVAINADNVMAANNKSLNNFTRAWRDAAVARPNAGVLDWFEHAVNGGDGIAQDPYNIAGFGLNREHGVYWTPDATTPPPNRGPNNDRTLAHTADVRQYAILVDWHEPEPRHSVNIARMYAMLRDQFNVPEDNIVLLSGFDDHIGDWSAVDAAATYNPIIDGNNVRATWINALRGNMFPNPVTHAVNGTNKPRAQDKLFIYNTGHGGQAWLRRGVWTASNVASNVAMDMAMDLRTDGVNFDFATGSEEASSIMDDPEGAGSMLLQLLLEQQINSDAMFDIPGVGSISAGSSFVPSPSDVFYYDGVLSDSLFAYQFNVPFSALASVANSFDMEISNLDSPYLDDELVAALSFIGGDQETAYFFNGTSVPEPATVTLLGAGTVILLRRRSR